MKDKLAIFDLDGTLVDTSYANWLAYKNASIKIGKKWQISFNDFNRIYFGENYKLFLPQINGANIEECEAIHKAKNKEYRDSVISYGRVNRALLDIIDGIKKKYYIALVTTASKTNTYSVLETLLKNTRIDLVITADDVKNLKPSTEAWEKAMEHFCITPDKTILFDDLDICIDAAVSSGIYAFKVNFRKQII